MTPEVFKKHKLTAEALKSYWTGKGGDGRDKLVHLLSGRLRDGIDSGLKDHKTFWAIDLAYDTPFAQTTYTLVRHILSKKYDNTKQVYDALGKFGMNLDEIVREVADVSVPGGKRIAINIPAFYKLLIPLVKAYTTIRQAKLFNDRNQNPLFKFEAVRFTMKNRIISEVITDIIARVANEYGYPQILRQAILQALRYGICLMFPQEEWHTDKHEIDKEGKEKILREGLRYVLPHPTRMAFDPTSRASTINTDTGVSWALYWSIDTYGNLKSNDKYWNTEAIPFGRDIMKGTNEQYFKEIFPCTLSFPQLAINRGAGESDRENKTSIYQSADEDKAVVRTEYFMKFIGKDYDMGTYPYPLWYRFVVASDDTVMWCAPLPYNPLIFMGYDYDDMRSRNAGLGLEILPFEDALGNVLSQWILSVKQNLNRAVFYDTDQISGDVKKEIENLGDTAFRGTSYIPFSSRAARVSGHDKQEAIIKVDFPIINTGEIASLMNAIISVLERVLVLSSHEIGQASTHEQTAEESRIIAGNTSTRVTFTGTFIDDGIDAWKRQLYRASRAYMDEEVQAQVTMNDEESKKVLEELGFDVEEEAGNAVIDAKVKTPIKAKMSQLALDSFINVTRDGEDRVNNQAVAASFMQVLQVALNNPLTAQAIGPQQALDLISQVAQLAGLGRDFKLKVAPMPEGQQPGQPMQPGQEGQQPVPTMEDVQKLMLQVAGEVQQATLREANTQIGEPLADAIKETQTAVTETAGKVNQQEAILAQLLDKLTGLEQVMAQALEPPPPLPNDQVIAPGVIEAGGPPPPGMVGP